jgi:hypothetical protein
MQCALMAESRGRVRVDGGEQRGRGVGGGGIRGALTAEPCTKKFVDVYNSVLCSIYIYSPFKYRHTKKLKRIIL